MAGHKFHSIITFALVLVIVLSCLAGCGNAKEQIIGGFTEKEIEAAKEVVICSYQKCSEGDLNGVNAYTAEEKRNYGTNQIMPYEYDILDIRFDPESRIYKNDISRMELAGYSEENFIYLQMDYSVTLREGYTHGPMDDQGPVIENWGVWLVRKDKDSPWLVYDVGY